MKVILDNTLKKSSLVQFVSHYMKRYSIAIDKVLFSSKMFDIFLISPQKHMVWIPIRSDSPAPYVFEEK